MGSVQIRGASTGKSGLSISSTGAIVLGNDVGDATAPAKLLSSREIPMNGFNLFLSGTGNLVLGSTTDAGERLQVNGNIRITNGTGIMITSNAVNLLDMLCGNARFQLGNENISLQINNTGFLEVAKSAVTYLRVMNNGNITINTTIDNGQKLQINGSVSTIHIVGASSAPTIAAGTGAGGAGNAVSVTGNDLAMTITVTAGAAPAAGATIVTVTFNSAFGTTPRAILVPANTAAIALAGNGPIWTESTTTLVLTSQAALVAATNYVWKAFVIQ